MADVLEIVRTIALHDVYLMFCMGVMAVPIIAIAIWYHSNINESEGGRQLMSRQNRWQRRRDHRGSLSDASNNFQTAVEMAKDIHVGRYGDHALDVQKRMYLYILLWLLAVAVVFGVLVWAVESRRTPNLITQSEASQSQCNNIRGRSSCPLPR